MQRTVPPASLALLWLLGASPLAQHLPADEARRPERLPDRWCRTLSPPVWRAALERSVAAGEVAPPDPRALAPVPFRPDDSPFLSGRVPCVTTAQIHTFADADVPRSLDLGQVFALMTRAANDVIGQHGDVFDFFGYFVSISPSWGFGAAFYLPLFNDVAGIGDATFSGTPLFDDRATLGIHSTRVQGLIMMHGLDSGFWTPGSGPAATNTRLVLAHELGHRWICYLPPLLDGRTMQGDFAVCASTGHWSYRIDSQASCLYLQEYVGADPAVRDSTFGSVIDFNRDTGGAFAWLELYLMGFATAAEVDLGTSELRYLEQACLEDEYAGPISPFSASDVVAAAGPRVPDAAGSQHHHRVAWILLHPPGAPPTQRQLDDMAGIMEQEMLDWNAFTLGRGTLDVTLFDACSDVQAYGCINPVGSLRLAGEPRIASTLVFDVDAPAGTLSPGAVPMLALSLGPDPAFPCGTVMPGWGLLGAGELLIDLTPGVRLGAALGGAPWAGPGQPSSIPIDVPGLAGLVGLELFAQAALVEPLPGRGVRFGLTDAVQVTLGP